MNSPILSTRDGDIATVTLNRPDKLNALTKPMWRRLGEVMRELSADDTLRCIVLRSAGGKAFSPGNDIGEFAMVGAGSVVTRSVRPHQLVVGNPARHAGWVDRRGHVVSRDDEPPPAELLGR